MTEPHIPRPLLPLYYEGHQIRAHLDDMGMAGRTSGLLSTALTLSAQQGAHE